MTAGAGRGEAPPGAAVQAPGDPGVPVLGTPGLWFAALGGAGAYALHLVAGFWLVPVACRTGTVAWLHVLGALTLIVAMAATASAVQLLRVASGLEAARQPGLPEPAGVPDVAVHGVLGAMLLGRVRLAGALLVAAAARRGTAPPRDVQPAPARVAASTRIGPLSAGILAGDLERVRFMAGVGTAMGGVSVLLVVAHWVPVGFFPPCL